MDIFNSERNYLPLDKCNLNAEIIYQNLSAYFTHLRKNLIFFLMYTFKNQSYFKYFYASKNISTVKILITLVLINLKRYSFVFPVLHEKIFKMI